MQVLERPALTGIDEADLVPMLEALARLRSGDGTVRLPVHWPGFTRPFGSAVATCAPCPCAPSTPVAARPDLESC